MPADSLFAYAFAKGLRAFRQNLIPGLIIQAAALGLLLAWFWHAPTQTALERLANWKNLAPYSFAFISTAVFGGLIPCLVRLLGYGENNLLRQLPWLCLFWGLKGMEVNALYEIQAWAFGSGHELSTVLIKLLVDQGLYAPLWAVPTIAIAYAWIEGDSRPWRLLGQGTWYRESLLPTVIGNAGIWVPTVAIIYCLPTPLQLPLQNLILCLWALLLVLLVRQEKSQNSN